MKLRNRTLLILGLVFLFLFAVIAVVSFSITMDGLDRLEYTDMNKAFGQVRSGMNGESSLLLSTSQDWGWWDETASFVATNDNGYVQRNLNPESLKTINVPLFLVLDPEGNLVYGRIRSPDFQQDQILSEEILQDIRNTSALVHHTTDDPGTAGVLLLPEGPMFIASTPIRFSDKSGPPMGTLIMGRYVENGPLQRIEASTGYVVLLSRERPGAGNEQFRAREYQLDGVQTVLVPDNESTITGYRSIGDLAGRPLVLGVTMQRDIYRAGLANTSTDLLLLCLWAGITALIVVFIMDHMILRRIDALSNRVRTPVENPDNGVPVLAGNDELAALERTILASRADLQMSERQLRIFINALPDPAGLYSRDGTILFANTALAAFLNTPVDELPGTHVSDHQPRDKLGKYVAQAEEAIRKKASVQCEVESGGKTLLITHYPVFDSNGEVIQIGLLTFDISEQKRLENALQKVTKKVALLNTVIFNDIQNKVFVQRGYRDLLRKELTDPRHLDLLKKQEDAGAGIESSLAFAREYSDLGVNPPRWQRVTEVMAFAISHLDYRALQRDFHLAGLEIYADPLLERVFFTLVENTLRHSRHATVLRAEYTITGNGAVIVIGDDGCGIRAENKERIFEKGTGTGGAVGLFLSREILSITGITIRETGEPGKGARFELLVPEGSYRVNRT
ncbi:CHASE4 domain-containing protein [Methanoregula sp.]|uniref:CHASE4 domain-containing protein n=1 Tax=Methanoregula sp. TaxID=2052170 RepID=UPI00236E4D3F|nr:CHASE4 domain-containing protein [Methanoregula sp.]MDD1687727.1 ATP-binding protein [Methanoregula sp.]